MSASRWPDWLHLDPRKDFQKNAPTVFRLIVSAITGAGLALSFTWLYFPVYAWISVGLLLMMVLSAKPRVAFFCGFFHAIVFVFASVPWIAEVLAIHYIDPLLSDVVPFLVLIAALIVRPWGLFGTREELDRV